MKRRTIILPSIILIPAFVGYLLYPLDSEKFKTTFDEQSYQEKVDFLAMPVEPDSVERPNIIWILVDDLGMADTDLYDKNGPVKTPHLNSLASEGVLFTNAYVSSPVCSPSRAAIATGRYNQRFGFEHQLHERYLKNRLEYYAFRYIIDSDPWVPQYQQEVPSSEFMRNMGMPESEVSLAEILKNYDYKTGYMGKWHLGKKFENSPNNFGFDQFYGFYASHSLYSLEGTPGIRDQKIPDDFTDKYIWEGQRTGLHAIQRNDKVIDEDRYLTTAITDESIDFMENHKEEGPFYLWASYNSPHTPLQAPEEYVNMFSDVDDPVKRVHYAMIKNLDDEIGRLMAYVDDSGLRENTLILFVSDNGGAEYNLTTDNGPYQGGKITNFEGGVKVPMIMSWKGKIEPKQVYDYPVHSTDLFFTSAANAKAALPNRVYDGADLVKHVNESSVAHDYIYYEMGFNRGIRDLEWKLTWNEDNQDTLLFNLKNDPFEQNNLYDSQNKVVSDLGLAFNKWKEKNSDPLWPSMILYYYTADNGKKYYFDQ